jgi:hypothetical protein
MTSQPGQKKINMTNELHAAAPLCREKSHCYRSETKQELLNSTKQGQMFLLGFLRFLTQFIPSVVTITIH